MSGTLSESLESIAKKSVENEADCARNIKALRATTRLAEPREQFYAREIYLQNVRYCLQAKEPCYLYDTWTELAKWGNEPVKPSNDGGNAPSDAVGLPRGFFLDLWDIWALESRYQKDSGVDSDLLRSFVAWCYPQFEIVLRQSPNEDLLTETAWRRAIWREILSHKDQPLEERGRFRKRIYSLLYQYTVCFKPVVKGDGSRSWSEQLLRGLNARACLLPGPLTCDLWSSTRTENDEEGITLVKLMASIYLHADHYSQMEFKPLGSAIAAQLLNDEKDRYKDAKLPHSIRREDLLPSDKGGDAILELLRYWAANDPVLWRPFLAEKFGFAFHPELPEPVSSLPAGRGCDLPLAIAGLRRVGKTFFLLASKQLGKAAGNGVRDLDLKTMRQDGTLDDARDFVSQIEDKWKLEADVNPQDRKIEFPTSNKNLFVSTAMNGMCRVNFFDVPGELTEFGHRSEFYQEFFLKQQPSSLMLLFDPCEPEEVGAGVSRDIEGYRQIVELLATMTDSVQRLASSASARSLPIYFVFNKSDLELARLGDDDSTEKRELKSYLDCNQVIHPSTSEKDVSHTFFTFRREPLATPPKSLADVIPLAATDGTNNVGLPMPSKSSADVIRLAEESQSVSRNLAYLALLRKNLRRVASVIDTCLQLGFGNISFVFTRCRYSKDKEYSSVAAFWRDLFRYLGASTLESRRTFLNEHFAIQLNDAHAWLNQHAVFPAELQVVPKWSRAELQGMWNPKIIEEDFDRACRWVANGAASRNRASDWMRIALEGPNNKQPGSAGVQAINAYVEKFHKERAQLGDALRLTLHRLLIELGISPDKHAKDLQLYIKNELREQVECEQRGGEAIDFVAAEKFKEFLNTTRAALKEVAETQKAKGFTLSDTQLDKLIDSVKSSVLAEGDGQLARISYDRSWGARTSRCALRDRAMNSREEALWKLIENDESMLQAIQRFFTTENSLPPDPLVRLLTNYEFTDSENSTGVPEAYRSLGCVHFDLDRYRPLVLNELIPKLEQRDRALRAILNEFGALLKAVEQVHFQDPLVEEQRKEAETRYLLEMLQRQQFKVADFISKPAEHLKKVSKLASQLVDLGKVMFRSKAFEAVRSSYDEVRAGLLPFTIDAASQEIKTLRNEIWVAEMIYGYLTNSSGQLQQLAGPNEFSKFADFRAGNLANLESKINQYRTDQEDRFREERRNYLKKTGWLSGLDPGDSAFSVATEDQLLMKKPASMLNADFLRQVFCEGIQALANKTEHWKPLTE